MSDRGVYADDQVKRSHESRGLGKISILRRAVNYLKWCGVEFGGGWPELQGEESYVRKLGEWCKRGESGRAQRVTFQLRIASPRQADANVRTRARMTTTDSGDLSGMLVGAEQLAQS